MSRMAKLELDGKVYELPIVEGTEKELAIDISTLRSQTGYITLDDGYGNTGSCKSAVTYIDGDAGILRYRGIPIEEIAGKSSFVETAWLVIFGRLPTIEDRERFSQLLTDNSRLDESMLKQFAGFPPNGHPMAILSAMINTLSTHERQEANTEAQVEALAATLISKVRTIAAASYKASVGEPIVYPRYDLKYVENFLHMMFSVPYREYEPTPEVTRALNLFLALHADHEQNARPPRCAWSPPARPTCSPRARPACVPCGVRCTAAPTSRSSRCWSSSRPPVCRSRSTSRRSRTSSPTSS